MLAGTGDTLTMELNFDHCYKAVQSRDGRFDGQFFTAVTSTGIYCRPICPARTPQPQHVRFYVSASAAEVSSTLRSPKEMVTASKLPSANGSASASAATKLRPGFRS